MKKLLLLSIFLLCTVLSLSACARNYKVDDIFDSDNFENSVITKSQPISKLDGMTPKFQMTTTLNTEGNLVVFKNDYYNYAVYDIDQNKIIASFSNVSDVSITWIFNADGTPISVILTTAKSGKTELYDHNGTYVATANDTVSYLNCNLGFFEFGDNIYRINDDKSISTVGKIAFLPDISKLTDYAAGYYYIKNYSSIYVYDNNLVPVSSWREYNSHDSSSIFVLSNGNVLIQASHVLPLDAKRYTYSEGDTKYLLTSYIMNPKNGKTKTVNLDYVVSWASIVPNGHFSKKSIKNVATIYPIENKRLLNNKQNIVSLTNNGRINGYLFTDLVDCGSIENVAQINDNTVIYKSKAGYACVADMNGEILAILGNYNSFVENIQYSNQNHIVIDNIIYDWNLNTEYDLSEEGMTVAHCTNNCIILKNTIEDAYYLYNKNGHVKKIGNADETTIEYEYYVIKRDSGSFDVYNYFEQKVATFDNMPNFVANGKCSCLIYVTENGENKFYELSE